MVTRTKAKTAATWTTKAAGDVGNAAYQALNESLDAAAGAAKLLRGDLGAPGRDRLREIERLVREAQRDLRRSGKLLLAELQALAEDTAAGAAKPRSPAGAAAPKTTGVTTAAAKKAAATRSAPAAKRAATPSKSKPKAAPAKPKATRRAAAAKAGATRTPPPAKRAAAAKPAAKRTAAAKPAAKRP